MELDISSNTCSPVSYRAFSVAASKAGTFDVEEPVCYPSIAKVPYIYMRPDVMHLTCGGDFRGP